MALIPRDGKSRSISRKFQKELMDPYSRLWNLATEGKMDEVAEVSKKILHAMRRGAVKPSLPAEAMKLLSELSRSRRRS